MQPATTAEWTCTRWAPAVVAMAVLAAPLHGQQSDSTAWMRRPEIRAVRAVVQEVQRSIDQRRLTRSDTTMCGGGPLEIQYTLYTDRRGVVRRLTWFGGSEDHAETNTFSYDSLGRLRFVLSEQAAVNGSNGETRVYWDLAGRVLHEDTRTTKGEGYPWAPPLPVFDPVAEIAKGCVE